ncbi:MAG: GNAT family N-acetyltransferase [Theionarchaea archaeon]|nr:GNAT family N-acetyltransferase [Theionarchaea archaeon]MBU7038003.1 GNAT family N-acetyltransferase [Theionarchaea archaeon]
MEPTIRIAQKQDLDVITELNSELADYHRALDAYYRSGQETRNVFNEYVREILGKNHVRIVVADMGGRVVGYCIGKIEPTKPFISPERIGKISDAIVKKAYRNCGIGRHMVYSLFDWFEEHGICQIELSVDSRNEDGVKAWESLGFYEFMKKMRIEL